MSLSAQMLPGHLQSRCLTSVSASASALRRPCTHLAALFFLPNYCACDLERPLQQVEVSVLWGKKKKKETRHSNRSQQHLRSQQNGHGTRIDPVRSIDRNPFYVADRPVVFLIILIYALSCKRPCSCSSSSREARQSVCFHRSQPSKRPLPTVMWSESLVISESLPVQTMVVRGRVGPAAFEQLREGNQHICPSFAPVKNALF